MVIGQAEHLTGQLRVRREMRVLAVDRHEPFGVGRADQGRQLVLLGVAAGVHFEKAAVHDVGPELREPVAQTGDRRLVAGDRVRAEHDECRPW